MSTVVGSAEELKELFCANSLKQRTNADIAGPISTIKAYRASDTVDRNRYMDRLIVQAFAENGEGVANELIQFDILDPENTGTFFILVDDDKEYPVTTTFDVTDSGGFIVLNDRLRTGSLPGTVTIRVTAPSSGSDAQATITRHLSPQTPARIKGLSGGNESFPIGSYVLVDVSTQLLDTVGQPVPFGYVRFKIHDPNETGTIMDSILYIGINVNSEGMAEAQLPVLVGSNNPGADFYIRADRDGLDPHYLFRYTTLS